MSNYGYIKHDGMSGYAIAHHGILGQKWGVRRFQNEDGSLTEEGRRRYGSGTGLNKRGLKTKRIDQDAFNAYTKRNSDETDKILSNMQKESEKSAKSGSSLLKKVDMIGNGKSLDKDPVRSKNAAIVGLKALDGPNAELDKGNIDWFLWEDQTTGMATVADLANQGYNKKQITDLIEAAYHMDYDELYGKDPKPGLWDLNEGYWHLTDKFIDNCIKYSKENKQRT